MKTIEAEVILPVDILAEMQQAADRAAQGVRDPELMRKSRQRMDRLREEIQKKHGILDIAIPAIRELRDRA